MPHLIAAAAYDGLLGFEYGIAREILGRDRSELASDWYDFLPCRVERGRLFSSHGLEIRPEGTAEQLARADTVLIAGWRDPLERPSENFLERLRAAHARGARLITICTGVFPLAYAGLLDGRRATTHWLHAKTLRRHFPQIRVEKDALYIHDNAGPGQISTSAGCAAGLDLCLAVVRADFGLRIANAIARRMVAPVHREGGQSQYVEAPAGTSQDDNFGPMLDCDARLDGRAYRRTDGRRHRRPSFWFLTAHLPTALQERHRAHPSPVAHPTARYPRPRTLGVLRPEH